MALNADSGEADALAVPVPHLQGQRRHLQRAALLFEVFEDKGTRTDLPIPLFLPWTMTLATCTPLN